MEGKGKVVHGKEEMERHLSPLHVSPLALAIRPHFLLPSPKASLPLPHPSVVRSLAAAFLSIQREK